MGVRASRVIWAQATGRRSTSHFHVVRIDPPRRARGRDAVGDLEGQVAAEPAAGPVVERLDVACHRHSPGGVGAGTRDAPERAVSSAAFVASAQLGAYVSH